MSSSISSSSSSTRYTMFSKEKLERLIDSLKFAQNRESTKRNYLTVWRLFNKFVGPLDVIPWKWEDRLSLCLINEGVQSSTLKSYISAVKSILCADNYPWDDSRVTLNVFVAGERGGPIFGQTTRHIIREMAINTFSI